MNILHLFTQDERTRQTREQHYRACVSDRCHSGDKPCPTPDQCIVHTHWLGRVLAWFGRFV